MRLHFDEKEFIKQLDDIVKTNVEKASFIMESEAVRRCPTETGALKNSIYKENTDYTATIGSPLDYAEDVEYGTKTMIKAHGEHDPKHPVTKWKAKTKRGGGTSQTMPFLRPALFKGEKAFLEGFKRDLR